MHFARCCGVEVFANGRRPGLQICRFVGGRQVGGLQPSGMNIATIHNMRRVVCWIIVCMTGLASSRERYCFSVRPAQYVRVSLRLLGTESRFSTHKLASSRFVAQYR